MIESLTAPENLPFAVALLLMLMIGVVEAAGLGASAAQLDADLDGPGDAPDVLGWLGFGRVPLLILLVVLLAWFGMIGLALQQAATAMLGAPLSPWLAAPLAAAAALPVTGLTARGLARVLPQDETTAVSRDHLLGKRATVTVGSAARGSPARASVRDVHGQVHYVMIEPTDDAAAIPEGETVLLVRREGDIFIGLYEANPLATGGHERPLLGR